MRQYKKEHTAIKHPCLDTVTNKHNGSLCIIRVEYTNTTDGYSILEQATSPDIREYAEDQIDCCESEECLKNDKWNSFRSMIDADIMLFFYCTAL